MEDKQSDARCQQSQSSCNAIENAIMQCCRREKCGVGVLSKDSTLVRLIEILVPRRHFRSCLISCKLNDNDSVKNIIELKFILSFDKCLHQVLLEIRNSNMYIRLHLKDLLQHVESCHNDKNICFYLPRQHIIIGYIQVHWHARQVLNKQQ